MKKFISGFYHVFLYSIVLALSFSSFLLFRPYEYVDNDHSYIRCFKDGISYETSPNLIFAIDTKLDSFNDAKARKLCEHKIISDYINSYSTPPKINYEFLPALSEKSSWPAALFVFLLTFLAGSFVVEVFAKLLGFKSSYFGKKFLDTFISLFD